MPRVGAKESRSSRYHSNRMNEKERRERKITLPVIGDQTAEVTNTAKAHYRHDLILVHGFYIPNPSPIKGRMNLTVRISLLTL